MKTFAETCALLERYRLMVGQDLIEEGETLR